MTATMMVDGRKRTQPVTLIHARAAPTGWLLAKLLTVVISPPKWHLKCEAMAVLVAQSPQARPRTWAQNPVPSFAVGSQTLEQILLAQMLRFNWLEWWNMWKVTLEIDVCQWSDVRLWLSFFSSRPILFLFVLATVHSVSALKLFDSN